MLVRGVRPTAVPTPRMRAIGRGAALPWFVMLLLAAGGCGAGDGADRAADRGTRGAATEAAAGAAAGAVSGRRDLAAGQLAEPRAVVHDADADVYLVSCVGGPSIARVAADGSGVEPRWIDGAEDGVGLRAPHGLALVGGELWVADGDRVLRFERATGAPRGTIAVVGASALRDLAVGPGPFVHASDAAAIWRIAIDGGDATALLSGADLGGPDGLAAAGNDLFVVTAETGRFALVEPSGLRSGFALPTAGLGGLVRTPDRRWFATSSAGRSVYAVEPTGVATAAVAGLAGPTGLGLDAARGLLLVPLGDARALAVLPLPPAR